MQKIGFKLQKGMVALTLPSSVIPENIETLEGQKKKIAKEHVESGGQLVVAVKGEGTKFVEIGDTVLVTHRSGIQGVTVEDEEFYIVRETDVLLIIK
jgi:co-chaperonin GroES (HSP10)